MSAKGQGDHPGEDLASRVGAESPCSDMKRAAVKKLIERYFYQLTDGCGNPTCDNQYCASSGKINLTANEAAAQAINLFSQDARLCDSVQPSKVPRTTLENPGPASLAKSLPNKNSVNPTCSVEDYLSESDDKSIVIDFSKSESDNQNASVNNDQSNNKSDKPKKKKHKKKSVVSLSSKLNKQKSSPNENRLLNKLFVLAVYLKYVDAKNVINQMKK